MKIVKIIWLIFQMCIQLYDAYALSCKYISKIKYYKNERSKSMNKLILKNGTSIELHNGADIRTVVTYVDDYNALQKLLAELTKENLSEIQVVTEGNVTEVYKDMAVANSKYQVIEVNDGKLEVAFSIIESFEDEIARSKSELEKKVKAQEVKIQIQEETIKNQEAQITDLQMALCEIYESV